MSQTFHDHFSSLARRYVEGRPTYPPALFEWLAAHCAAHDLAWDCATGNGQAAVDLAHHFIRVVATDASERQLAEAPPHGNIEYRVASAEASGLPDHSVDLVTVAQALHWFDIEAFHAEARRVLKPGGLIAEWCYGPMLVEDAAVNALLQSFYTEAVGAYWPPERAHVESGYRDLAFPFPRLDVPPFTLEVQWPLAQVLGYLSSWSATAAYRRARNEDPVERERPAFEAAWGDPAQTRTVRWPMSLRVGWV